MFTASQSRSRTTGVLLTVGIVALTLTTASIHFSLGGLLFLLNAAGYATAAVAIVVAAWAPHPFIARFSWLPRVGLIGYTLVTIVGYLVMGPYFTLGFIAKGVEVVLIALLDRHPPRLRQLRRPADRSPRLDLQPERGYVAQRIGAQNFRRAGGPGSSRPAFHAPQEGSVSLCSTA